VVFNDCLRVRDACYAAGERISDTEVQRRVITLAKATPERAWLSEVASVALVQACQDARRAYRNWFDSLTGRRKGPRIGRPKPRRKRGRQSIRLTRNGFSLHGERLYVAKVGDIRVAWSRNILAAGRADRLNACGGDVRPGHLLAVAAEAGTHRSAA
jgi:putative transposase